MHAARVRFVLLAAACLWPATAAAQGVRLDIVPAAGVNRPLEALGAVTTIEGPWYLHLERAGASPAFGATAELTFPASRFGARITGTATLPGDARAFFLCRPDMVCPAILIDATGVHVSQISAVADLVFSITRSDAVRPYIAAGAGLRRYGITWPDASAIVEADSYAETIPALHVALGFDLRIAGGALRAEIGNLWSPAGDPIGAPHPTHGTSPVPGRQVQNDLGVHLGWRLFRF